MEQKQTAVEWLEKNISLDMNPFELIECFNKAKEMEKEQSAIADVVMWLYEKHGIWIYLVPAEDNKEVFKPFFRGKNIIDQHLTEFFESPTEAYKAAINYTLENLIKKWAAINKQQ